MKTLYFECNMGAAGDMLTAALLELTEDRQQAIQKLNAMGIPGIRFEAENASKCGIAGTHMKVTVDGQEEQVMDVTAENHADPYPHAHEHHHDHAHANDEHHHDHDHEHHDHVHSHAIDEDWHHHGHDHDHDHGHDHHHDHDHEHDHHHAHGHHHEHHGMKEIREIIDSLNVSEQVKADARAIYQLIADAESHAHGAPVDQIHFHEVGAMDAVADVAAAAVLMEMLAPDRILCSPINTGKGEVKCAHGIIPVPAPATAHILQDVPTYNNWVNGELCTPTGAAILKHFVQEFGDRPVMRVEAAGYGMGHKDFPEANCVRAFLGDTSDGTDQVIELSCNVDDMTGEAIGYAMETLLAKGAREVFVTPVLMKKSRPGQLITVICSPADKEDMVRLLFCHTTTIGIRETAHPRYVLERKIESAETDFGTVRAKVSTGYGVKRKKYEYDDLARIAAEEGLSIQEVLTKIGGGK